MYDMSKFTASSSGLVYTLYSLVTALRTIASQLFCFRRCLESISVQSSIHIVSVYNYIRVLKLESLHNHTKEQISY